MKPSGFVLMELAVVLALCALLATVGLYAYTAIKQVSAYADLALIRLALRSTVFKALVTGTACTVRCSGDKKIIFDHHEYDFSDNLRLAVIPGTHGPPARPERTISDPVTYRQGVITCHPDGLLQPGTLYFTDGAYTRQYAVTIPVSSFSYIRIYDHRPDGWHLCTG